MHFNRAFPSFNSQFARASIFQFTIHKSFHPSIHMVRVRKEASLRATALPGFVRSKEASLRALRSRNGLTWVRKE